ncbi:Ig-like domain repeat protein [Viridibacillus arvi]|uniref:Ig-like domain repeat protein n=1 Tax=Viridibacillus arvi TaxID=263475 RepID=UPI0036E79125
MVSGVKNGLSYNKNVSPNFNEGTANLSLNNGVPTSFVTGSELSEEGEYKLVVTDRAGNKTTVNFTIDKTAPIVTGVMDGSSYNNNVSPTFSEGTAILSLNKGVPTSFVTGSELSEEGEYNLVVTDQAGNKTTISFIIDTVKPLLTSASSSINNTNSQFAKIGDTVTILIKANEDVTILEAKSKIADTMVESLEVTDAGDQDASTWAVSFTVSELSSSEGTVNFAWKMTDKAGNITDISFGSYPDNSMITVDTKPSKITSGIMESTSNQYVDVTFSEATYGGSAENLGALDQTDFEAIITKSVGASLAQVTITGVTKTDDMPLVGGETVVRVYLSLTGTPIQGDKIKIKAADNAIFDHVGNVTSPTSTTDHLIVTPLVTYEWKKDEDGDADIKTIMITFTKGISVSPYMNTKERLMGAKYKPDVFLTTPTPIGGDVKVKISVSAGWDNNAVFGATANGVYAQATSANTISLSVNTQCSKGGGSCFIKSDFRKSHALVTIEDISNPAVKTILDLNIDSNMIDPIVLNEDIGKD